MITDLGEIWIVLAVPFVIGCLVGSLIYRQLSFTRLAPIQDAIVADFGGMRRSFFGSGRRRKARPPVTRPTTDAPVSPAKAAAAPSRQTVSQPRSQPSEPPVSASTQRAAPPPAAPQMPAAPRATPTPPRPVAPPPEPVEVESFNVRPPTPQEVRDGRPPALMAPYGGEVDDLRRIRGIGESYEARLHGLGIFHFDQIAAWSLVEAAWVAMQTGAGDRVVRFDWIGQARALAGLDGAPPEEE